MTDAPACEIWCLHGAFGSHADWRGLAASAAAAGVTLRAVDLWRFLACGPLPPERFGAALNALALAGEPAPRVLLGYSMGGRLALHALAADTAGLWNAAVIVSADPGIEDAAERARRRAHDAGWAAMVLGAEWAAVLAEWDAQPVLESPPACAPPPRTERDALVRRRREIARSFVDWSTGAHAPLWERLPALQLPVLWVAGAGDAKFRAMGERAVGLLGNGHLWLADGAGHRVPWDQPTQFAGRLFGFLAEFAGG